MLETSIILYTISYIATYLLIPILLVVAFGLVVIYRSIK